MSEYVLESLSKITWNDLASAWIWILAFFFLLMVIDLFVTIINDSIKEKKKEEMERICLPYKVEYERLNSEEKYEEALEYAQENNKYLKEVYHYW